MNNEELLKENEMLKNQIEQLKLDLSEIKEHLKKYTAPSYKKSYYENNKEIIKQKHKEYKPSDEQKKQWARTAYLKKKDKLIQENNKF